MSSTATKTKKRDGSTMPKTFARCKANALRNDKIKDLYENGDSRKKKYRQVDLAKRFNLTQGAISQILNNPNATNYWEYE